MMSLIIWQSERLICRTHAKRPRHVKQTLGEGAVCAIAAKTRFVRAPGACRGSCEKRSFLQRSFGPAAAKACGEPLADRYATFADSFFWTEYSDLCV